MLNYAGETRLIAMNTYQRF